jgi:hypothetical protein
MSNNLQKNPGGRPSKFNPINLDVVELLAKKGFTDREISICLNVTEQTFNNWKKANQKFFESLKSWKAEADEKVEKSLYERAQGYSHPDTWVGQYQGEIITKDIVKHYPPDATSMIFWLKNRQPAKWRDKQEVELTKPLEVVITDYTGKKDKENLNGNG